LLATLRWFRNAFAIAQILDQLPPPKFVMRYAWSIIRALEHIKSEGESAD